jgi:hypothetical protein
MQRHEIPTHLSVEDKAVLGLTMRQLLTAAVGLALAYGAAGELPLPLPVRLAVASVVLVVGALVTLWRPAGRSLDVWAFVLLQYTAAARVAVWRPGDRVPANDSEAPAAVVVQLPVRAMSAAAAGPGRAERSVAERKVGDA